MKNIKLLKTISDEEKIRFVNRLILTTDLKMLKKQKSALAGIASENSFMNQSEYDAIEGTLNFLDVITDFARMPEERESNEQIEMISAAKHLLGIWDNKKERENLKAKYNLCFDPSAFNEIFVKIQLMKEKINK